MTTIIFNQNPTLFMVMIKNIGMWFNNVIFQCDENIEIDEQALKADFPSIYQPQSMRESHYLFCWEAERRLLRISSVITKGYLR